MWLVTALCFGLAAASFIQLHDKNFTVEDPRLVQRLRARLSIQMPPPPSPKDFGLDSFIYQLDLRDEQDALATRFANKSRRAYRMKNVPQHQQMKLRLMDIMQLHVYATQYRMRDMQTIVDKYANDIRFRMGYALSRLETLIMEMNVIYTRMYRSVTANYGHERSFYDHLCYYTYMAKKNVDVTYIVEHLFKLHTSHMNRWWPVTIQPFVSSSGPKDGGGPTEGYKPNAISPGPNRHPVPTYGSGSPPPVDDGDNPHVGPPGPPVPDGGAPARKRG